MLKRSDDTGKGPTIAGLVVADYKYLPAKTVST